MQAFWQGVVLGLSIAAPVGPVGVMCIRRTLTDGRAVGFAAGLGAATADMLYGMVSALGLVLISDALVAQQFWLRLLGGAFLCYLGIRAFLTEPIETSALGGRQGLLGAYVSTFFLTLTNPMTILSFAAVYAGLGLGSASRGWGPALVTVLGVFVGSGLWWGILSASVSLFRARFTPASLVWVNRVSGVVIVAFGVVSLFSVM